MNTNYKIYLAGEIHSTWREEIIKTTEAKKLPFTFYAPITDHQASDNVGVDILGEETNPFWKDRKGADINAVRTQTLIEKSDIVIVKFGDKYRQWNAAFDAGYASAFGKKLIIIHPPELGHPLKEIDAAAQAVAENTDQVIEILEYIAT